MSFFPWPGGSERNGKGGVEFNPFFSTVGDRDITTIFLQEMRLCDADNHFRYFHMSKERFGSLWAMVFKLFSHS